MAYGSGLSGQIGASQESTPGTAVTVTKFFEFNSESLGLNKTIVQGQGLRAGLGSRYARSSRRAYTTKTAGGSVEMDLPTNGLGFLLRNMIGSPVTTGTQQGGTTAYLQAHRPGSLTGLSMTVQKGVPQTDGTVKPFTYRGTKVTSWEISCAAGEIGTLSLDLDSWDEVTATALATASYTAAANVFHFAQGTVYLGGTPTTASSITSIAGGTAVASITGATVSGDNALATDRYFFGTAGVKAEQLENDWGSISGTLEGEFVNQATIYDLYAADTATVLELKFVGSLIAGAYYQTLSIIVPNIHFEGETPKVGGPDVVGLSADFTGLDNAVDNAIQFNYISTDTAP